MLPSASVVVLLLTLLGAPATTSNVEHEYNVKTTFGHVCVHAGDVEEVTKEGEAAYLAAKSVLGLQNPRFSIVDVDLTSHEWGDLSSDGRPIYVWQFKKGSNPPSQPPPTYLLRHEIGHDLFIRYLVPSTTPDQYGGDAPDWLDEMAAVAFEGEALRAGRRRTSVRAAGEGKLIPLQRFFTMAHPEMAAGSIPVSTDRRATAFDAQSNDTLQFYSMASSFYDFLVSRIKNDAIVAELAAAFRRGEPLEQWILARTGYSSIQALNAQFENWIASDPRYGGASTQ